MSRKRQLAQRKSAIVASQDSDTALHLEPVIPTGMRGVSVRAERRTVFAGPLPPHETVAGYEQTLVGAANRVFVMAEKEQDHRHESDKFAQKQVAKQIADDAQITKRAQIFAFIIAIFGLLVSGVTIHSGAHVAGTIIGALDITALVGAFLYTRKASQEDGEGGAITAKTTQPALPNNRGK